jgi:hypothetical protein
MSISHNNFQSVTCYLPSKAFNGYTLFAPMGGSGVWLMDMKGQFVHHWEVDPEPGGHGVLLSDGNLLYGGSLVDPPIPSTGPMGGKLIELDWEGNRIWEHEDPYMHHDFCRLPNGNTMIVKWVKTPNSIAAKVKGGMPDTEREGVVWADAFQEITPEGQVAWEWLAYEHLDPEKDAICPLCARAEWTHVNACSVLPNGDILTSFLTLNTIAIIDRATGKITWRWGPGELAHQHDPTLIDNGHVLVFDNGSHRPSNAKFPYGMIGFSRVLEVDPKRNEIAWEYKEEASTHFNSSFISGCRRLPNGNTLICEGSNGRFFEVTPEKELVWEYINPFYFKSPPPSVLEWNNTVFRAYRYSPDYPGLKGKVLDPERYELTLRERKAWQEKVVQERMRRLGY